MSTLAFILRVILIKFILKPFLVLFLGVKFRYKEKLDFKNSKIIVANHNSHIDAIAILSSIPIRDLDKVHPVVARDYFYKNTVTKMLAKIFLNSVSVSRSREYENPLEQCEKLLQMGHSLIIFPEGTRGNAGELQKFKNGVSLLLKKYPQTEFLPAYCEGFGDLMPKGEWMLLPFNSSIQFGIAQKINPALEVNCITQIIRDEVLALSLKSELIHV